MFESKHYVPILKWKPAERRALQDLSDERKSWMTPLVQPIMPQPKALKVGQKQKTKEAQLQEVIDGFKAKAFVMAEEIVTFWGKTPIILDLSLVYTPELRAEAFNEILSKGDQLGAQIVPLISLTSDDATTKKVVHLSKQFGRGLCLRLVRADIVDIQNLSQRIQQVLVTHSLSVKDMDLILDLNVINETDHEYYRLVEASQTIPHLTEWRTFTVASGAFPEDLTKCTLGDNYIPRVDWNRWLESISSTSLKRRPSFADYTIQHPIYKESAQFFLPSASIRYTLPDQWLVMRGKKGESAHYLAGAASISQSNLFRGADFSPGDAYIAEKGKDIKSKKTGNATSWLTAGINHHLACTADQIANLP